MKKKLFCNNLALSIYFCAVHEVREHSSQETDLFCICTIIFISFAGLKKCCLRIAKIILSLDSTTQSSFSKSTD